MTRGTAHKEIVRKQKNSDLGEIKVKKKKVNLGGLVGTNIVGTTIVATGLIFGGHGTLGAHPGENGNGKKISLSDKSKIERIAEAPKHKMPVLLAYAGDEKLAENTGAPDRITNTNTRINTSNLLLVKPIIGTPVLGIAYSDQDQLKEQDISKSLKKMGLDSVPKGSFSIEAGEKDNKIFFILMPGANNIMVAESYWKPEDADYVFWTGGIDLEGEVIGKDMKYIVFPKTDNSRQVAFVTKKSLIVTMDARNADYNELPVNTDYEKISLRWDDKKKQVIVDADGKEILRYDTNENKIVKL